MEYKRLTALAYPLRDFRKICRVCTPFQDALAVKISLDLLKGVMELGFKLTGSGYIYLQKSKFPQNCGFWPPEADTMNTFI